MAIRVLNSSFPAGKTIIHLSGKGINREVINSVEFIVSPYEDPWNLGVVAGYVKVVSADFLPGSYEKLSAVTQVESSNTLVVLKDSADFVRNQYV